MEKKMKNDVIEMEAVQQKSSAVATRKPRQLVAAQPAVPTTPMELLRIVTERGASVEEIGKFMDLMERQQANEARQAFVRAMAAFKKNPPDIYKKAEADFTTSKGRTNYSYATLGDICDKIIAALADHGISHDWDIDQPSSGPDASMVIVTCTLTHEMGGTKSASFKAPPDNTGSKNAIQSIGSSVTYAERYSLLAACGIAVKAMGDDDGRGATPEPEEKPIVRESIAGNAFVKAVAAVKDGTYTTAEIRKYYALTTDQETVLLDLERAAKS